MKKSHEEKEHTPLLYDLKIKRSDKSKIEQYMFELQSIAGEEIALADRKKKFRSGLYLMMKQARVEGVALDGCGTAKMQLMGARSTLNEAKLRANLLKAGVTAAKVDRLVTRSKIESKGRMVVVFSSERGE